MKSAKKLKRREEPQQHPVQVKAESEPEETFEVCVGEHGFNVQIKEEPHSQEIGGDPVTSFGTSDVHQQEGHIKEEPTSVPVKEEEEEELWLKEERDSEAEDDRAHDREEGGGTGRRHPLKCGRVFLSSIFQNLFEPVLPSEI